MLLQSLPTATPKKVIVAISGGVDSALSAALLKRAGFNVVGVFMKFWSEPGRGSQNRCCFPEAQERARRVANKLGIPFYVFNFEKEFKKRIVDYFLKEYKAGHTPNPCVVCNKEIKFGLLLEKALLLDADFIATGHYACLRKEKTHRLLMAKDKNKDQSYFLWQLSQKQLKHILFPVGHYAKKQVKGLAKKFKLPISGVAESMEVCFIRTTINDFLSRHIRKRPGKIVDAKGKIIGKHLGLAFYTIGQRKGIGLPGGPYWVLNKDIKKNALVVTRNEKDLLGKELTFKNVNWLSGEAPKLPLRVKAKIRYRHQLSPGVIVKGHKLIFDRPQRAITSGQSVVFYCGEEVLGGGIIAK